MIDPGTYFWLALKAAALSKGGLGSLPSLQQDLTGRGWATNRQFAEALAVGQLAPGPTGLWAVALGFMLLGPLGAVLATVAITIPPLLTIPISAVHARYADLAPVRGAVRGLALAVGATIPVSLLHILGTYGLDWRAVVIIVASMVAISRRVPLLAVLGAAALGGALVYR